MKIVKSVEESALLIKEVSKTIKNDAKEQRRGFSSMLLGTLGATLWGNVLEGKSTITSCEGATKASEGIVGGGQDL